MNEEPTRRQLAIEILVFALLFLLVGAAFVTMRVLRDGTRVLDVDPRRAR